jgi:hypothetical protein
MTNLEKNSNLYKYYFAYFIIKGIKLSNEEINRPLISISPAGYCKGLWLIASKHLP